MSIGGKIKFGFVSFIALGIVLWLANPAKRFFTEERGRESTVFTLDVNYGSRPAGVEVLVSYFVNNSHFLTERAPKNPWVAEHHGKRTDVVRLVVTQSHNGEITCSIMRSSDLAVFTKKINKANQICEVETK